MPTESGQGTSSRSNGGPGTSDRPVPALLAREDLPYRILFGRAPEPMLVLDASSLEIVAANLAAVETYGYERDELIGLSALELRPEDEREDFVRHVRSNADDSHTARRWVHRRKDGSRFWVDVAAQPLELGDRRAHLAVVRDVSDRVEARRALERSERRWRELFEANVAGVVRLTFDGEVVDANAAFAGILGVDDPGELEGTDIGTFLEGEEERKAVAGELLADRSATNVEVPMVRRDGERVWVLLNASLLDLPGDRNPTVVATAVDVTERKRRQRRLERFETILQTTTDAAFVLDERGEVVLVNGAFRDISGLERDQILGRRLGELLEPEAGSRAETVIAELRQEGRDRETFEFEATRPDGQRRVYECSLALQRGGEGAFAGTAGVLRDVTDRRRFKQRLEESESHFRTLFEEARDAILVTRWDGRILDANQAAHQLFGYEAGDLVDEDVRELYADPRDRNRLARKMVKSGSIKDYELQMERGDGGVLDCLLTFTVRRGPEGAVEGFQGVIRDVTSQKELEKQLEHRALRDWLTDLPNRALFRDRLQHALQRANRTGATIAVLFVDLDRFKVVNDSLGYAAGDQVLAQAARRFGDTVRAQDTVARVGGDEFTVLLEDVEEDGGAVQAAERLLAALEAPVALGDQKVHLEASVGIAVHDGGSPEASGTVSQPNDLVRMADVAMSRAKDEGGDGYRLYDADQDVTATARIQRENELREAIEDDQFQVFYQPIVCLENGRICGLEPLARWFHPEKGTISPAEFIPLAEETGLIRVLGMRLLEQSCRDMDHFDRIGLDDVQLTLHPNLSARQLEDPALVETVERVLGETGVDPGRVEFEVTETVVMRNAERVNRLKELGVSVSVDDFGTGYSSLSYLRKLDVDGLKIDMTFVQGLGRDERDTAIVRTIITLGRTQDLTVVGEGIEEAQQLRRLRELGCHQGQGYYFAQPMPAADLSDWLRDAPTW